MVDDPDDASVDRGFRGMERKRCFAPANEKHDFFNAASSGSFSVATTSPMTRASCTSAALHFDLVDDADDGGVDGTVLQA